MKNIFRPVITSIIVLCLGSGLLGCSSPKAALNSGAAPASNTAAAQGSGLITSKQQIKDINVKTPQGQTQVDTQIDKHLQSLDSSLDELDQSLGNL